MNLRQRRIDKAEVNLTPLIDVVFLLLIFFMVSTTFESRSRLKVELPEATTEHEKDKQMNIIKVQVSADGSISLNDGNVLVSSTPRILRQALSELAQGRNDVPVIIKADAQASHQSVMTVMDVASQIGLSKIIFAARKPVGSD
ncbi:ExbD/TolR family protein [Solemya velum gill symbiont]|uniref:ExbD/TolR family protein n=1 Tax=Solemya velum gill symbiont TaxID=2340 RepID=UPI0009965AC6|nr:biopolymer transporter ExbD [Solemya velum gill symbiont]OOZ45732.1 hypothetical protein BOW37_02565 [Solemya velum gill symbiont]OOZ46990.1 hypothetical protein BOW38_05230 [Solemya velum gill symbiont]OOZ48456.1 hypothetical protein BOW39_10685 [Solemya velum gill symbiont]OOZ52089.1 hypothetical protein BOW40_04555 [Solemya velum gill symbiont]OOZ54780.1 hypothetical protein BOW41_05260 [Solemya velum gill symbiont]